MKQMPNNAATFLILCVAAIAYASLTLAWLY